MLRVDKSNQIILEALKYKTDALNQFIPDGVTQKTIFCAVKSVTRTEWTAAAQLGMKAAYCVTVWADEYDGETVAILDGMRYGVYRTYQPNPEEIELYLQQKVGT